MTHAIRSFLTATALVALSAGAVACGSSGSDGASSSTTAAGAVTTTRATATTQAGGSTAVTGTTQTVTPGQPVDCEALLIEYSEVFLPDDLAPVVAFFRKYEPAMPDDVAAASERLAAAYEEAGDLGHVDVSDVDLTADSQTFVDWTNDGCPQA